MWWFALPFFSFLTGLINLPRWSLLAWPATSVATGALLVQTEPPGYDMHGLGFAVGLYTALACVATWILGRGLRRLL